MSEKLKYTIELVWDPELDDHVGRVRDGGGMLIWVTRPDDFAAVAEDALAVACQREARRAAR